MIFVHSTWNYYNSLTGLCINIYTYIYRERERIHRRDKKYHSITMTSPQVALDASQSWWLWPTHFKKLQWQYPCSSRCNCSPAHGAMPMTWQECLLFLKCFFSQICSVVSFQVSFATIIKFHFVRSSSNRTNSEYLRRKSLTKVRLIRSSLAWKCRRKVMIPSMFRASLRMQADLWWFCHTKVFELQQILRKRLLLDTVPGYHVFKIIGDNGNHCEV